MTLPPIEMTVQNMLFSQNYS